MMPSRMKALWSVTAIRLSVIYSIVFGVVAAFLVFYVTSNTANILRQEAVATIEAEIDGLDEIFRRGGINRLIRTLDQRSRAPGAHLYLVTSAQGQILAGNVESIASGILDEAGWTEAPFHYERFQDNLDNRLAMARIFILRNGMRILVGRDTGEADRFRQIIARAISLSLATMVLLGILTWIFVGRRALKRIDMVSRSTSRIMRGDLDERLPLSGAGDEFDRLSSRMNEMLERISGLNTGLREVSDNIAHDLKTPITRLRSKLESALAGKHSAKEYREILTDAIEDSDQLIKTFNALLMISRLEAGSSTAELAQVDLSAILGEVAELYEPLVEDADATLAIEVQPDIQVTGNRELLSQAISNLIDNATKYASNENGEKLEISLALQRAGKKIVLSVADNGLGIPPEHTARVQERFVRMDSSRSEPGTGLGLSLVKAIATIHGATLDLKSNQPGLLAQMTFSADRVE